MKRIPCPVTQQELEALVKQGLTDAEIGALLPDGTGKRVASWRQSFGIEAVPQWARGSPPSLDNLLIPLLVGSMMGDGRLVHQGNSTYFCETHCGKQLPYLQWKADRWGTSWVSSLKEVPDKRGFVSWRMRTRSHKDLTYWRDLFYPDRVAGYKQPDIRLLPYMSAEALAIWYLDDGHAGWWPSIAFGGSPEARDVAMQLILASGITTPPIWVGANAREGHENGSLVFKGEQPALDFLSLIQPYVPECMGYKLKLGFQGPHFQIRARRLSQKLIKAGVKANKVPRYKTRVWVQPRLNLHRLGEAVLQYLKEPPGRTIQVCRRNKTRERWTFLRPAQEVEQCLFVGVGRTGTECEALFRIPWSELPPQGFSVSIQVGSSKWDRYREDPPSGIQYPEEDIPKTVEEAFAFYRERGFPYPQEPTDAQVDLALQHLDRVQMNGKEVSTSPVGLGICSAYMPHRFSARNADADFSAVGAFEDDVRFRRALEFALPEGLRPGRVRGALTALNRTPVGFRPSTTRSIVDALCPVGGVVLDPCAGWGGRLLGVLSSGRSYVGVEPQEATIQGLRRIAERLGMPVQLFQAQIQHVEGLPEADMAITSPPFWTKELYGAGSERPEQSVQTWQEEFLRPMFEKVRGALKPGSAFVVHMADVREGTEEIPLVSITTETAQQCGFTLEDTWRMPKMSFGRQKKGRWDPILVLRAG